MIEDEDSLFVFADEEESSPGLDIDSQKIKPWKVLIADDDEEIHRATALVFQEIVYEGAPIEALHSYSGAQTVEILKENPDVAVVLLDVVMESDDAGLVAVRRIREELDNRVVRIILRTGQPGAAPERSVITDYEINDYKDKTELTLAKLYTTIVGALRNYRDIKAIERSRMGLEKIIANASALLDQNSLRKFSESMLTQLLSLLHLDESSIYIHKSAFAAMDKGESLHIHAATGDFEPLDTDGIPPEIQAHIDEAIEKKSSLFFEDCFVGYFNSKNGAANILYLSGTKELSESDMYLIKVFCTNVEIAYDNVYLNMEILETQKEMILKMGDIIENRSKETANHVYRVAEYSYYLALEAGLSEEEAEVLRHASPMHDCGKVGICDSILLKPGKLTPEEFETIKTHTTIGYKIFQDSHRKIVRAAAIVAYQHHEKWNGTGYPQGLAGEDIHIFGRITALADVFDALSHKREYKEAWSIEETLSFLKEEKGRHFDPSLVDAFFRIKDKLVMINSQFPD